MNKFFESIKKTPSLLRFLNKQTLNQFKANPDLFPDGNTESEASVFQMNWNIVTHPDPDFFSQFNRTKFSWIPLANEDEPPVLVNQNTQELLNCFNSSLAISVQWMALNQNQERVFLDVSGSTCLAQIFPLTPRYKNDLRRLMNINKARSAAEEIQKENDTYAKFISQMSLVNSEEDCFLVDSFRDQVQIQYRLLQMINNLSYDELLDFSRGVRTKARAAIMMALDDTPRYKCVALTTIEYLQVTPIFKFLFV